MSTTDVAAEPGTSRAPRRGRRGQGGGQRQSVAGWLFVSPTLAVLGLFLVIPILMALWVSFSDWNGRGSPFSSRVNFVGRENYAALLTEPGLSRAGLRDLAAQQLLLRASWSCRCRRSSP